MDKTIGIITANYSTKYPMVLIPSFLKVILMPLLR